MLSNYRSLKLQYQKQSCQLLEWFKQMILTGIWQICKTNTVKISYINHHTLPWELGPVKCSFTQAKQMITQKVLFWKATCESGPGGLDCNGLRFMEFPARENLNRQGSHFQKQLVIKLEFF